jgi:3-hydroxyisobutyrate dehydrogenase-like beta-hydroxyacid dehydrogenase
MYGFIGLGDIGGAIARRLLESGNELVVFDARSEVMDSFKDAGAILATSAREVANQAKVVCSCLPSPEASLMVAQEVAGGSVIEVYAELSTIGRQAIMKIDALLAGHKIELVDAPVSGGSLRVTQGTLSLMTAGPAAATERLRKMLSSVSDQHQNISTVAGQAQLCKLVNNAIGFTAFLVSCEAIAVGASAGVDPTALVNAVNAGSGRNAWSMEKFPRWILPRSFNAGPELRSALKDIDLYLEEAEAAGMPPSLVTMTRELWMRASNALGPGTDVTQLVEYFEGFVGGEVSG